MAIEVTCPGCQKKFKVSDQFAGKQGPCPQCKTVITIPTTKPIEVKIHAPESGPKDASGRPVLKPISRKETRLSRVQLAGIIGGVVATLGVAVMIRLAYGGEESQIPPMLMAIGAILLAPPLVLAGYSFLRDQELEPHRGRSILLRTAICSAVYALLWGFYAWMPEWIGLGPVEPMHLAFILPVMAVMGGFAAFASLDLEFGTGVLHYALYLVVTVVLCFLVGWPLWNVPTT